MARFRSPSKGRSTSLLAGALLGLTLIAAPGCDYDNADKRVDRAIAQALPKMGSGSTEDLNQAQTLLDKAARENDASVPLRIRAKVLHGQCQLALAAALQPQIDETTTQINRLAWDIQSLAAQIQSHNQVASALSAYDPSQLQAALKKESGEAQGSADQKDWVKVGSGSVPTLSAVNADIATLQSQVSQLQDKIKSLTDQRTQIQSSADQLMQQSDLAKGDQAVALFRQAADNRKQSDALSLEIDQNNVQLSRAQTDLSVKQGQQAVINQAITDFGDVANNSGSAWAEIQKLTAGQRDQAKALLGDDSATAAADDPTGGATISSKASAIAQLAQKNQAARAEALPYVNTAISDFRDAVTLADQLQHDVQTRNGTVSADKPDAVSAKAMLVTLNSGRYRIQQADAQARLATLSAGQAAEASSRQQLAASLKPILDQAKLSLPQSLQDPDNKIADAIQAGRKEADEAYQAADELLGNVVDGATAPEEVRKAAHADRIFLQYGWYLLASSVGDNAASAHLQAAQAERDTVLQNGGTLRNLPPELAVAPTTAPSAAGAAPAGRTEAAPPQ